MLAEEKTTTVNLTVVTDNTDTSVAGTVDADSSDDRATIDVGGIDAPLVYTKDSETPSGAVTECFSSQNDLYSDKFSALPDHELLSVMNTFVDRGDQRAFIWKQRFNFTYFLCAAFSTWEFARGGCDIRVVMDYFARSKALEFQSLNFASHPGFLLSILFLTTAALALQFCFKKRKDLLQFSTPNTVRLSKRVRGSLRFAALAIPVPFFMATVLSVVGYSCMLNADAAFDKGEYEKAKAALNIAAIDPGVRSNAFSGLAQVYWHQADGTNALSYAKQSIELDPKDANGWKVFAAYTDGQESLDAARKAVNLDPTEGENYRVLFDSALNMGFTREAVDAAREHNRLHYDERDSPKFLAQALSADGQFAEALKVIEPQLQDDADNAFHALRSEILDKQNSVEQSSVEQSSTPQLMRSGSQ